MTDTDGGNVLNQETRSTDQNPGRIKRFWYRIKNLVRKGKSWYTYIIKLFYFEKLTVKLV